MEITGDVAALDGWMDGCTHTHTNRHSQAYLHIHAHTHTHRSRLFHVDEGGVDHLTGWVCRRLACLDGGLVWRGLAWSGKVSGRFLFVQFAAGAERPHHRRKRAKNGGPRAVVAGFGHSPASRKSRGRRPRVIASTPPIEFRTSRTSHVHPA